MTQSYFPEFAILFATKGISKAPGTHAKVIRSGRRLRRSPRSPTIYCPRRKRSRCSTSEETTRARAASRPESERHVQHVPLLSRTARQELRRRTLRGGNTDRVR